MKAHTPGPWKVHNNIGRKGELGIIANAAPCVIACMSSVKAWPVEAEANARLIAAAPELLEEAKLSLRNVESLIYCLPLGATEHTSEEASLKKWADKLRTAIAKAEGT